MNRSTNRRLVAGLLTVAVIGVSACGSSSSKGATATSAAGTTAASTATTKAAGTTAASTATTAGATTTSAKAGSAALDTLAAACKTEGQVNLIALPDDWADYKDILQAFRDKYPGVKNPVANPEFSSQQELDAVKNLAGQKDMPDSIDVSPAKAQDAVTAGYWSPYKPTTWDQIPDGLKDPSGNWVAAYYGIIAITANTTIVKTAPKTFADLKKADYKGKVYLNDDPRKAGSAFAGVVAAALANGGTLDNIEPGIQYFIDLKKAGNFVPGNVTEASTLAGETPLVIDWSYNVPGLVTKMQAKGFTVESNIPSDGLYGGYYSQGVIKSSPHPNCAKLWVEHILSDEGALGYLKGGAVPARIAELVKAGKVTADAKKNLPADNLLGQIKFMTQDQIKKANDLLTAEWDKVLNA